MLTIIEWLRAEVSELHDYYIWLWMQPIIWWGHPQPLYTTRRLLLCNETNPAFKRSQDKFQWEKAAPYFFIEKVSSFDEIHFRKQKKTISSVFELLSLNITLLSTLMLVVVVIMSAINVPLNSLYPHIIILHSSWVKYRTRVKMKENFPRCWTQLPILSCTNLTK